MLAFAKRVTGWAGRLRRFPREAYYTLTGWRFDDLKRYVAANEVANKDASLASLLMAPTLQRRSGRSARIAIVSTMPPDETGIAGFMLRHGMALKRDTDIFTRVRDTSQFLRTAMEVRLASNGSAMVHPLSALEAMDVLNRYQRIVFVLGNSHHNTHVLRSMLSIAKGDYLDRCVCYLHDPVCHHVMQLARRIDGTTYVHVLNDLYGESLPASTPENWEAGEAAVRHGILGVRGIVDAGVRHIIVNSLAAANLVSMDLSEEQRADTLVTTLFHPVFPREIGIDELHHGAGRQGGTMVVGTFGEAAESKLTNVIVDAVGELRRRGQDIRLVVAGYRATDYIRSRYGRDADDWLCASEPNSERNLQLAMARCHVAIQLRARNLGESSGVVPTLIGLGIPTIVSPVGAFLGYGDAVARFAGSSASELGDLILKVSSTDMSDAMSAYTSRHSLEAFERAFADAIQQPRGLPPLLVHPYSDSLVDAAGELA